jgi:5-oxoprolinase (ATP-hydrolysing) subunit B
MSAELSLSFSPLGEAAMLAQVGIAPRLDVQARIWAVCSRCAEQDGIVDVVSGMNSFMVIYDPGQLDFAALETLLGQLWRDVAPERASDRLIEVPVIYGGPEGSDLVTVAEATGLSIDEVVRRHSAAEYTVFAIGADPGFAYMAELDPALELPRLASPRLSIPAGSVIIAGRQAGVQPIAAPCGWHILGQTRLSAFDPTRLEPAMFRPGDRVRFIPEGVRP